MLYSLTTNLETKKFIEKYLDEKGYSSRNPIYIQIMWEEINKDLNGFNVRESDIANYIRKYMSYENYSIFTKTLYWIIVSDWVKLCKNFFCEISSHHNNNILVAHHPGYYFHGYEIQTVHLLICLCESCHDKFNGGKPNDNIFKFPLITEKYIAYQLALLHHLVNIHINL